MYFEAVGVFFSTQTEAQRLPTIQADASGSMNGRWGSYKVQRMDCNDELAYVGITQVSGMSSHTPWIAQECPNVLHSKTRPRQYTGRPGHLAIFITQPALHGIPRLPLNQELQLVTSQLILRSLQRPVMENHGPSKT